MKTHLKISPEPIPEHQPQVMLCGAEIAKAKFQFWILLETGRKIDWAECLNSLNTCAKCRFKLEGLEVAGEQYVYCISEETDDDRASKCSSDPEES